MSGTYGNLAKFLKTRLPDFAQSPEYQLHDGRMDDVPGVILAAFGTYLGRLTREDGPTAPIMLVLEELAKCQDAEMQAQLRDEVFEAIERDQLAESLLQDRMTERLREMYGHWKSGK